MFDQLKFLMQDGERYIVVEGGKPEYVLMRWADYASLRAGVRGNPGRHRSTEARSGEWERANAELEEVRAGEPAVRTADYAAEPVPPDPTTIRLEDLPL